MDHTKLKRWVDRWYGDGCPPWTWPGTAFAVASTGITAAKLHGGSGNGSDAVLYGLMLLFWVTALSFAARWWWRDRLKPALLRRWAKSVSAQVPMNGDGGCKTNLSVDWENRSWIHPITRSWQSVYNAWPNGDLRGIGGKQIDTVFYKRYICPLHHYCMRNLEGSFYLWKGEHGANLILTEPRDRVMWKLTWGNRLPTPAEIFEMAGDEQ